MMERDASFMPVTKMQPMDKKRNEFPKKVGPMDDCEEKERCIAQQKMML